MCFSRGEDKIEWASKHEASQPANRQPTLPVRTPIVLSWKHIFESNYKQLAFMQLLHLRPRQVDIFIVSYPGAVFIATRQEFYPQYCEVHSVPPGNDSTCMAQNRDIHGIPRRFGIQG